MLQNTKKPIALVMALVLCLSLLSGIVLPQIAETALAADITDPYADVTNAATPATATVEDTTVTIIPDGEDVGTEYKLETGSVPNDITIYIAPDNMLVVDPALSNKTNISAIFTKDGITYDLYKNGNGTNWGNGKYYFINDKYVYSDYANSAVISSGNRTDTNFAAGRIYDIMKTLKKSAYVIFAPGRCTHSTSSANNNSAGIGYGFTSSHAEKVYYLGPQAGKNPLNADGELAGGRTRLQSRVTPGSKNYEYGFGSSLIMVRRTDVIYDGFSMADSGANGFYITNAGDGSTITLRNSFIDSYGYVNDNGGYRNGAIFASTNSTVSITVENSYINQIVAGYDPANKSATNNNQMSIGKSMTLNNVTWVQDHKMVSERETYGNIRVRNSGSNAAALTVTNCRFINFKSAVFSGDTYSTIKLNSNKFINCTDKIINGSTKLAAQLDISPNLYLDNNNNVIPAYVYQTSSVVNKNSSDSYYPMSLSGNISCGEMKGNLSDLFALQRTNDNLIILHSSIGSVVTEKPSDSLIRGTATFLCEAGKTYATDDLFKFRDGVVFDGVYSEEACATEKSTIAKGFGTCYAKAHLTAGGTTATVIYTLIEPTKYIVVAPNGETEYTFNGDTFTSENATFVNDIATARNNFSYPTPHTSLPATDVILLMPGSYSYSTVLTINTGVGCNLVGPQAFNCPVAGNAKTNHDVQGGRSADPTTEAVFTSTLKSDFGHGVYTVLAGIAFSHCASYDFYVDSTGSQSRTVFFTLQNIYSDSPTEFICTNNSASSWVTDNTYIKGCYVTGSTNLIVDGEYTNLYVEHCGFNDAKYSTAYLHITPSTLLTIAPFSSNFVYTDGFIIGGNTTQSTLYLIGTVYRGNKKMDNFANGAFFTVDNMYLEVTSNHPVIRNMPGGVANETMTLTNNKFVSTASTAAVVDQHVEKGDEANYQLKTDCVVSGNEFYTKNSNVFSLDSRNSIAVSENYYADSNGCVQPLSSGCSGIVRPNDYYVGADLQYKVSDFTVEYDDYGTIFKAQPAPSDAADRSALVGDEIGVIYNEKLTPDAIKGAIGFFGSTDLEVVALLDSEGNTATEIEPATYQLCIGIKGTSYTAVYPLVVGTVWQRYGLAPHEGEDYVDMSKQNKEKYGGIAFVADDFTKYAKDENGEAIQTLAKGTVFYATMPTTGITYKLKYGVTAFDVLHVDTAMFGTLVFFPGEYTQCGYGKNCDADGYVTTEGTGNITFGRETKNNGNSPFTSNWKHFVVLGPQAGICAADVANGTVANGRSINPAQEAVWGTASATATVYVRNNALRNDASITFDGFAGNTNVNITTQWEGANYLSKYNYKSKIILDNCYFKDIETLLYSIYAYGGSIGSTSSGNIARATVELEWKNSYYSATSTMNNRIGSANLDGIYMDNDVIIRKCGADTTDANANTGFYINPTTAGNNSVVHDLNYVCTNSYLDIPYGFLYGAYWNSTSGINTTTRPNINVTFDNNKVINAASNTLNQSRSNIYCGLSGNADIAAAMNFKATDNEFLRDSDTATANRGSLFTIGCGSKPMQSVDISHNTFKGYMSGNLFDGFANYDITENLYYKADGTLIAPKNQSGVYTDILLGDYEHRLSDLDISYGATDYTVPLPAKGTTIPGQLTGSPFVVIADGSTPTSIKNAVGIATNAEVKELYDSDGSTAATAIEANKVYYLEVGFEDSAYTARYKITADIDLTGKTAYSGDHKYYDPAVAGFENGTHYLAAIDGQQYYFTVGENVFADFNDISAKNIEDVYLFAKTYDTKISIGGSGTYRGKAIKLHGAKHGVSPVTLSNGIPTNVLNPQRSDPTKETIMANVIETGYQRPLTIDGVTFTGDKTYVNDTSAYYNGQKPTLIITNCVARQTVNYNEASDALIMAKSAANHTVEVTNNYFDITFTKGKAILMFRDILSLTVTGNYLHAVGGTVTYFDSVTNSKQRESVSGTDTWNISNNRIEGELNIANMLYATELTATIDQNYFVNNMKYCGCIEFDAVTKYQPTNTGVTKTSDRVTISNNTFTALNKDSGCYGIFIGKVSETDPPAEYDVTRIFTLSDNTFDNTNGGMIVGIRSLSDDIDASDNTFIGFPYNYGDRNVLGSVAADNPDHVTFSNGNTAATFMYGGETFIANEAPSVISYSQIAASGEGVFDSTDGVIYDITFDQNYIFNTLNGLMAKVTVTPVEGTPGTYYNYIPKDPNGTVTVKMIKIDGTEVTPNTGESEELKLEIAGAPLVLTFGDQTGSEADGAGNYTTIWEGKIAVSNEAEWQTGEFFNKANIRLLDYGMYYSGTKYDDFSKLTFVADPGDDSTAYYKVDNKKIAKKVSFEKTLQKKSGRTHFQTDGDGTYLDRVYSDYVLKFTGVKEDTYRYGQLYLTFSIGYGEDAKVYTIVSDEVKDIHTPKNS